MTTYIHADSERTRTRFLQYEKMLVTGCEGSTDENSYPYIEMRLLSPAGVTTVVRFIADGRDVSGIEVEETTL